MENPDCVKENPGMTTPLSDVSLSAVSRLLARLVPHAVRPIRTPFKGSPQPQKRNRADALERSSRDLNGLRSLEAHRAMLLR
jgi:hypothetical protein